jgi:hypothetical protein
MLAIVNAIAITVAVPMPVAGIRLRVEDHLFDLAETVGVGALVAILVWVIARVLLAASPTARSRAFTFSYGVPALSFAANVALVRIVLGHFLELFATHGRDGWLEGPIFVFYLCLLGGLLAAAPYTALLFADHPRLRLAPAFLGACTMAAAQVPLRDDYEGVHCLAVWGAILLASSSLAPVALRLGHALWLRTSGRVALASLGLVAVGGLVVVPANAVRFELFRQPCALAPWVLASLRWPEPLLHASVTVPASPWFRDRAAVPPVPPREPPALPPDAVVVFITIDALRADVMANPDYDARFPTFAELKTDGVVFARASSAGAETVVSLSEMFASTYYSQQMWGDYGAGVTRFPFPNADPGVRFPELLSAHGVATGLFGPLAFFAGDFGMTRGFRQEVLLGHGKLGATGNESIAALLKTLEHATSGPLFLYTHLLEPHAPYPKRGHAVTDYERYLAAVQVTDGLVGRVEKVLSSKFGDRWALFVSADHGEAFGEHGTTTHAKTLYEELLHVPLLARSPRFPARTIEQRVGLIDMGPTILDLFGVATPGVFMGQSLVPLLAGGDATLTRPLLAEGRLRKALTEPDGLKVIDDPLRKVVQVYDLTNDPAETRNLFDVEPARSDIALATLRAFFGARTRRESGYVPPYAQ